jgi:hypothetical protein
MCRDNIVRFMRIVRPATKESVLRPVCAIALNET